MTRYNIINGERVQFTEQQEAEWNELQRQYPAQLLVLQSVQVREERDALLAACDWRASTDVTMSTAWRDYRQALRDVPSQLPDDITWPSEPS
tara:strand:+ start:560 stop:835 length:276 start_codon:yes stop_codon:yes gene_type:complete